MTVFGGTGGGLYEGGGGHDLFVSQGAKGIVTDIYSTGQHDLIVGSAHGSDDLTTLGKGDTIIGGGGSTDVNSAEGQNNIMAGAGTTYVFDESNGDTVTGGTGKLYVTSTGDTRVEGSSGAVSFTANQTLGQTHTGTLRGGSGSLTITENTAYLIVTGGSGALNLTVGSKDAKVTEGSGKSTYDVIKGEAGGSDNLYGFKAGTDKIDLDGYTKSMLKTTVDHGNLSYRFVEVPGRRRLREAFEGRRPKASFPSRARPDERLGNSRLCSAAMLLGGLRLVHCHGRTHRQAGGDACCPVRNEWWQRCGNRALNAAPPCGQG